MMKSTFQGSILLFASFSTLLGQSSTITLPARSEYAAKFVCGISKIPTETAPLEPAVKRGNYATTVNIHNPNAGVVVLLKSISRGAPERYPTPPQTLIAPTTRVTDSLPSGYTLYVDCAEIVNLLKLSNVAYGSFIEGYVVIESYYAAGTGTPPADAEVDVVAVTTTAQLAVASTANGGDNGVNSHEVTPVAVRKLPAGVWPK